MRKAIGLIEVTGYVAAVEAADSAVKAANVTLIGIEKVKAGISTVKITGDVGAVKAAVDAAAASADSLGLLRACHVIPRVDEQVDRFFFTDSTEKKSQDSVKEEVDYQGNEKTEEAEEVLEEIKEEVIKSEVEVNSKSDELIEEIKPVSEEKEVTEDFHEEVIKDEAYYNSMKVEELRRYVRNLHIPTMTNKQIKFAKKDVLVKAILDYNKAGGK